MQSTAQDVSVNWLPSVLKQAAVLNQPAPHPPQQPPQPQDMDPLNLLRFCPQAESPLSSPPSSALLCGDATLKRTYSHLAVEHAAQAQISAATRCLFPPSLAASPQDQQYLAPHSDSFLAASLPSLQGSPGLTTRSSKASLNSLDDVTRGFNLSLVSPPQRQEGNLLKALLSQQQQRMKQQQQHDQQQQQLNLQLVDMLMSKLRQPAGANAPPSPYTQTTAASTPPPSFFQPKSQGRSHGMTTQQALAAQGAERQVHEARAQAELQQLRQIQNVMWDLQCLHSQSMPLSSTDVALQNSPALSSCSGTSDGRKRRRMSVDSEADSGLALDLNCEPDCH